MKRLPRTAERKPRAERFERAIARARELIAKYGIQTLGQLRVALIAEAEGASVRFGATGPSDARTIRAGALAWICVNERARGTPRGRWSIAHELAHFLLHPDADAIERIHKAGPKSKEEHLIEREADIFATELLMPGVLFERHCKHPRPSLRDVDRVGALFGTSLQATAKRYAELATSGCAALECRNGTINRASRSASFAGEAFERRVLEEATFAAAAWRGERVAPGPQIVVAPVWGRGELELDLTEEIFKIPESHTTLVWLTHGPIGDAAR
jgi:hypothetical protein